MLTAIHCTLMRGGTSKGLYFNKDHLPADQSLRDQVLLAAMGSPDLRQIDGVGGAHPLTSKVAVISKSSRPNVDVDYLFLQVAVDKAEVSDSQNCGNILAGVGPWAIENGFVAVTGPVTPVHIYMVNTASLAIAHVPTPQGEVEYEGDARIDGVPGTASAIWLEFLDVAGSSCGSLLPTGSITDVIDNVEVTCIDNGMPVVILNAADFGLTGKEMPEVLEANASLKQRIEAIRLQAGHKMNLGDVTKKTVPKMSLVSPAFDGGTLSTRTFIPHRVHDAIGVLGAVSVATAAVLPNSVAFKVAAGDALRTSVDIEHPTGYFTVNVDVDSSVDPPHIGNTRLLRTARKLMSGQMYVPEKIWSGKV